MNRLKIYLFWMVIALVWSSCYRGNEYNIDEQEPVFEPDTTVISYYGNLTMGTIKLPADTIYSTLQVGSGPGANTGYSMEAYVEQIPTFSFFWEPLSPSEEKITAGDYTGCCSIIMDDSSLNQIQEWVLRGRDNNQPLILDSIVFQYYLANNVNIKVSNVTEAVKTDTLSPGMVWITDQATVQLSGIMINAMNNQAKAISGSFTCYFGRKG